MNADIQLLDVVALATDIPKHNLFRGEIGAVVECYPGNGYEVEFVALDGYTYALLTLRAEQLIPLRRKTARTAQETVPATSLVANGSAEIAQTA